METSDSECFESADEDLNSDDENTKTIIKTIEKGENREEIQLCTNKLDQLRVTEAKKHTTKNNEFANNDQNENIEKQREKDIENNPVRSSKTTKVEETVTQTTVANKKLESTKEKPTVTERVEANLWDDSEISWGDDNEKDGENMWENDNWEPIEEEPQKSSINTANPEKKQSPIQEEKNTSWSSWGSWDVSSIISTATQGVSTLTHGISTVLESGIGVPDPEELAKINKAEQERFKSSNENLNDSNTPFGLSNLVMGVSHLTKFVETTSTKVISGGLDTLETIGKKTMEVLQEGDPGLKKKRAFLKIDQDKPVLSQVLREAKEKAEQENKALELKHFARKANYESLFDDHQGLVHLEALEMLSKQCDIKLQSLLESYTDEALVDMQETLDQVKELCELPDEEDDEQNNIAELKEKLETAIDEIKIPISYKKLFETWDETESWLKHLKLEICDERELHQQAIETLAQLTAIAVEQFHKAAELLLVKEHRSTADEADSLVQLTTALTSLIGVVAAKFSDQLNAKSSNSRNKEEINSLITNVFFEAANSSSYIQDAFQLLIPVLQVGAV